MLLFVELTGVDVTTDAKHEDGPWLTILWRILQIIADQEPARQWPRNADEREILFPETQQFRNLCIGRFGVCLIEDFLPQPVHLQYELRRLNPFSAIGED